MKQAPFVIRWHNVVLALPFFFSAYTSPAQTKIDTFDIVKESIFYPEATKLNKIKFAVLLLKYKFPEAWLEGSYHVPFLNLYTTLGLTKNFSAQVSLGTIILSNQLSAGFRWNKRLNNKFAFNIGYDLAGVFGRYGEQGYDARIAAIIHYPNMSFGYRYKDIAFTIKSDVSIVGHVRIRTGENVISDEEDFYNGFSVGLYMEQRLWKNNVIVLGLKNHYAKLNYIAWPAFSTFNRFYNIPEISIGLVLR